MAEGSETYAGLAVPLFGESEIKQQTAGSDILTLTGATSMDADFIVCQDVDGTEIFYLRQDGFMRLNPTTTISAMGFDCRMAASSLTGVNVAGNFRLTVTGTGTNAQSYALWAYLDLTSWTIGSGRAAALHVSIAGGSSTAMQTQSFINFQGDQVQTLFTLPGQDLSTGCVVAKVVDASTHAIRINIGDTHTSGASVYYIMVTSCAD